MDPKFKSEVPLHDRELAARWSFLDREPDACSVVTWRMEVVYLNAAARSLVSPGWFGCRCWEVFPVGDSTCAARCPAVKAVNKGNEIVYCEETLYPGKGTSVTVGVAVIPLGKKARQGDAVLLIRPKIPGRSEEVFRRSLLERAQELRELCAAAPRKTDPLNLPPPPPCLADFF
ncbi:MAG: hypothetical protein HY717_19830 [Planctomycetes bacterium]|nr:hypothetical protein [Planctomycetota bacterium]